MILHAYMHLYARIHTNIHVYLHTYMHTYIYTYMYASTHLLILYTPNVTHPTTRRPLPIHPLIQLFPTFSDSRSTW